MCGCTCTGKPNCCAYFAKRSCTERAVKRVPFCPINTAGVCAAFFIPERTDSHVWMAWRAGAPMGTMRGLLPLPNTWTSACARSIQPSPCPSCTWLGALMSKPTISETRSPDEYNSSIKAWSRSRSSGLVLSEWFCVADKRTASSTERALGKDLAAFGERTPNTGFKLKRFCLTIQPYHERQADK